MCSFTRCVHKKFRFFLSLIFRNFMPSYSLYHIYRKKPCRKIGQIEKSLVSLKFTEFIKKYKRKKTNFFMHIPGKRAQKLSEMRHSTLRFLRYEFFNLKMLFFEALLLLGLQYLKKPCHCSDCNIFWSPVTAQINF